MAGRFSVESVFRAIDKVTAPVSKMQNRISKFTRKAKRGFASLNKKVDKFGKALKTASVVGVASLLVIGGAMANVISVGAEFEQTLVNAAAKFPEGIRRGTKAFKDLETVARRIGGTTEFTASQAAQGLNFLAMAGFNAEQAMAALPGIVDLATVAQIDLATASDIATDSLGAFGLATKDPIQLGKNLARVNDNLAFTSVRTNTTMEALFEGIVKGGAQFTATGQSIESFNALMGVMANAGLKGSEAGTVLRNMMVNLGSATGSARKLMEEMGVEVADSEGNFRDILDIMVDFEDGLKDMGEVQKSAAIFTVFGKRSIAGMNVQLKEGSESLREFRDALKKSTGKTKEMADVMRDTLKGDLNSAKSAIESVKLSLFGLKDEALRGIIQSFTTFTRKLSTLIETNKNFVKILDGLTKILLGAIGIFAILIVQFVVLKAGIIATTAWTAIWSSTMFILSGIIGTFNILMGIARIVMLAFNIAMAANPVGAVILAIVALIALGLLLINNWDDIVAKVRSSSSIIKTILKTLMTPLLTVIKGISLIAGAAKSIFFGGGDEEAATEGGEGGGPQVVTPQARLNRTIEENRNVSTAELTIKDTTGKAELTKKGPMTGIDLQLQDSGSF